MDTELRRVRLLGAMDLRLGEWQLPSWTPPARNAAGLPAAPPRRAAAASAPGVSVVTRLDPAQGRALPDADRLIDVGPRTLQWRGEAPWWLDVEQFQRALAERRWRTRSIGLPASGWRAAMASGCWASAKRLACSGARRCARSARSPTASPCAHAGPLLAADPRAASRALGPALLVLGRSPSRRRPSAGSRRAPRNPLRRASGGGPWDVSGGTSLAAAARGLLTGSHPNSGRERPGHP